MRNSLLIQSSPMLPTPTPNPVMKAIVVDPPKPEVKLQLTKSQMLHSHATSIESISKTYAKSSGKWDALMDVKRVENHEKCKKLRIQNLKSTMDLGIIGEEDFKICVKEVLEEELCGPIGGY